TQMGCTLRGELDICMFQRAWEQVVERHAALRTAFVWEGLKAPVQAVQQRVHLPLEQHDWRDLPPAEQDARLASYLADDRRRGFDLAAAPLMRLALFRMAADAYSFLWSQHHLLLDGWSVALVLNEVLACYTALLQQQPVQLARPRPYRDYIV